MKAKDLNDEQRQEFVDLFYDMEGSPYEIIEVEDGII